MRTNSFLNSSSHFSIAGHSPQLLSLIPQTEENKESERKSSKLIRVQKKRQQLITEDVPHAEHHQSTDLGSNISGDDGGSSEHVLLIESFTASSISIPIN